MFIERLARQHISKLLTIFAFLMFFNGLFIIYYGLQPLIIFILEKKITSIAMFSMAYNLEFDIRVMIACFVGYFLVVGARGLYKKFAMVWFITFIAYIYLIYYFDNIFIRCYFIFQFILGLLIYKIIWRRLTRVVNYYSIVIIFSFIFALAYGIVGSYLIKSQFTGIKTWTDSVYFTLVTYSTLGYGDIIPITQTAKCFVISMIIIGLSNFATAGSYILYSATRRIQLIINKLEGAKSRMKNHIIICGYSSVARALINRFIKENRTFLLIDVNQHPELDEIKEHVLYHASPSSASALAKANFSDCKMVLAMSDIDAENILTMFNARELKQSLEHKTIKLLAKVTREENIDIAKKNGADEVIAPTIMAANAIIKFI